ncbi:MAG TPA: flagellar biosynthesis protein FlhB [Phycisphaerae bacterium]|nr:flagellar biosynthesis protein FlhB [Phycisphaerae bacterium]
MADDAGERTEQPTPRRRQEAREKGNIPRSIDLTGAAALLGGLLLLAALGRGMFERLLSLTRGIERASDVRLDGLASWLGETGRMAAALVLPFLLLILVLSLVVGLAQTGGAFVWKRLTPKLDALNPANGVKRLFSMDAVQRLGLGLVKIALVGVIAWHTLWEHLPHLLGATGISPMGVLYVGADATWTLALRLGLVLLIVGVIDLLIQRWKVERSLRMTRQEVRDEMKNMDGDPLLKQRRRQLQARLAMQRLQVDVPRASVVVTNPTEYAVALRYDEETMSAPRVVAKGRDWLALRIRLIAEQNHVPVVERPPLARALYASLDVGQEVSPQFYRAVAEVLAFVQRLRRAAV